MVSRQIASVLLSFGFSRRASLFKLIPHDIFQTKPLYSFDCKNIIELIVFHKLLISDSQKQIEDGKGLRVLCWS